MFLPRRSAQNFYAYKTYTVLVSASQYAGVREMCVCDSVTYISLEDVTAYAGHYLFSISLLGLVSFWLLIGCLQSGRDVGSLYRSLSIRVTGLDISRWLSSSCTHDGSRHSLSMV